MMALEILEQLRCRLIKKHLFLALLVLVSKPVLGEGTSEFYIEEGLVSKIFKETSSSQSRPQTESSSFTPMLGFLNPSTMTVANKYFKTDYSQLGSMPYLYLNIQRDILNINRDRIVAGLSVGYGYLQQKIYSQDSSQLNVEDTVSLQWVPMEVSGKYVWSGIPKLSFKPSVDIGLGRVWVHQDGNIDGIDHGTFHSYGTLGSTFEFNVSDDFSLVTQVAYLAGIGSSKSEYQGFKMGVGAWLSI